MEDLRGEDVLAGPALALMGAEPRAGAARAAGAEVDAVEAGATFNLEHPLARTVACHGADRARLNEFAGRCEARLHRIDGGQIERQFTVEIVPGSSIEPGKAPAADHRQRRR